MTECVKCGHNSTAGDTACRKCTWPFSPNAWKSTTQRIRRVTLDTGCVNAKGEDPSLNALERWAADGLLHLQRADVLLKELKGIQRVAKAKTLEPHPNLFILGSSTLGSKDVLAGPDRLQELQRILFPNVRSLTQNQLYDIEHLRLHVLTGGDIFITHNPNDFITRGRQENLMSLGIWVLTPANLVSLLRALYGWS